MGPKKQDPVSEANYRVKPAALRWRCDPASFSFRTTKDIETCPISTIGQERAERALTLGLSVRSDGYNIFAVGEVGSGRSTVVRRMLRRLEKVETSQDDLAYVHNFQNPDEPKLLRFPAGKGKRLQAALEEALGALGRDLPKLFESDDYRSHRAALLEQASREQKEMLKEFERRVQSQGFALVQVQLGPLTRPQLVPVVAGNPVEMEKLEELAEQGQFKQEELAALEEKLTQLRTEMEGLGKTFRNLDRAVRRRLAEFDQTLSRPLVDEALSELLSVFESEGLEEYVHGLGEDLMQLIQTLRESQAAPTTNPDDTVGPAEAATRIPRYHVNVLVDNSETTGRPIIWETAPSYRNLFGAIERVRTGEGDWETDHMHIRGGSLLRANGGFLVLDALDVLVEPAVWPALKRTLRTGRVEIQHFDPMHVFTGVSLKPEPIPVDVKVVMIGTRAIYNLLYQVDEDFKKIFKIKAEFAMSTPLNDQELQNYACFVHKKVNDDDLLPFHRDAVAGIVEYGVRLSGSVDKLTTRFTEIADLVRESGFWAARQKAKHVKVEHVDVALENRVHRFNLVEELLRQRIADGMVLLDLEGAVTGQVNGLAVLDQGDHQFALPSRITATTAMGRAGVIDLDREAEMSGAIHTKGVLILTGYLRSMFAQNKPLALTASLSFEQNYGGVDGDSASSAELYALLSALADVPIEQGIAVTGSVNQKGEVQPIGGVNEKIEGYFQLCRLVGLTGRQGVMIPRRNLPQLMLHKDVVEAVRKKQFGIWSVCTIQQGLEVLTGMAAGTADAQGAYPEQTIYGRADRKLSRLAEQVRRFGAVDTRGV